MKFIDFFAGVGGFRRGLEPAGHECVGFCEFDKYATASYTSMHLLTDKQREYLSTLDLKKRQKEILKEEYRNGEWYANDVRTVDARSMPKADCWCFGFPCQDISVAGKQLGFNGSRSSLFFAVTKLIDELEEKDRPKYLFIENVKNLLSVNGGFDFAKLLIELDRVGYDAEWQICNSKDFGVPQNRERVFIIGHIRGGGTSEVFPIEGTDGENCVSVKQIGQRNRPERENLNQYRVYGADGLSPCLNKMDGGRREPHLAIPITCSLKDGIMGGCDVSNALMARDYKGIGNQGMTAVAIPIMEATKQGYAVAHEGDSINLAVPGSKTRRGRVGEQIANTLDCSCNQGIFVRVSDELTVYAIWYEKYGCYIAIRKLTPKECFRLQGWSDEYFERAQFVNSDSQLYKQAGNGVTVSVIEAIGRKME